MSLYIRPNGGSVAMNSGERRQELSLKVTAVGRSLILTGVGVFPHKGGQGSSLTLSVTETWLLLRGAASFYKYFLLRFLSGECVAGELKVKIQHIKRATLICCRLIWRYPLSCQLAQAAFTWLTERRKT
jgi:hypothetical protein